MKGLSWGPAAISNATWSGARLCDVLKACGLEEGTTAKHVQVCIVFNSSITQGTNSHKNKCGINLINLFSG